MYGSQPGVVFDFHHTINAAGHHVVEHRVEDADR